jgi:putative FmdB family regulatory protein
MPLYEYLCETCGHRFETIQKFSDPPLDRCPKCGGALRKLQSAPAFQFKGSGWYVTDYARKDQQPSERASKEAGTAADKDGSKGAASEKSGKSEKPDKSEKSAKTADTSSSSSSSSGTTGSA